MGEVWRARDTELGRVVALKLLQRTSTEDLARFRREAHAVAQLTHPNIAQLYEFSADPPYLAMQFVEGEPIAKPEHLAQAARAVHFAHENGILHRDLKPANILVSADRAYVLDFGLAREVKGDQTAMSLTGDILGTPSYMSPEQARGQVNTLDARTDVYGLGATLYALLMGRPPHTGSSAYDVITKVINEDPALPPGELGVIAMKALEKDSARRYATAAEFADDLERHFRNEPIRARPASLAYRLRKQIARRPAVWGLSAVLTLAVVGGSAFGVVQLANVAAERAQKLEEQETRLRTEEQLRGALEAQVDAEREAAERMRIVGVMESAGRRLAQFDEDSAATMTDEELAEMRRAINELIAQLQAELEAHEEEASSIWYLIAEAHRILNQEDDALAAYDESLAHGQSEWGRTIGVESRAALGRALARMGRMQDLIVASDVDRSRRWQEAREQFPLIETDLARAGEQEAPPRLRHLVRLWGMYLWAAPGELDQFRAEASAEIDRGGRNEGFYELRGLVGEGLAQVADYAAALDRHRGRARGWFLRGVAHFNLGEAALAIADFDEAVRLRPDYASAIYNRGRMRHELGEIEGAVADYDEAIRLRPDNADAFNSRAVAFCMLGEFARAVADCDVSIRLRPGLAEAFNTRGNAHQSLGEFALAIADYDEAIRLRPDYAEAFANRGVARRETGDLAGAGADFSECLRLASPDWRGRARVEAWLRDVERRLRESSPDYR